MQLRIKLILTNILNVQTEGCRLLLNVEVEIGMNLKGLFMQMFKAVDQ